MKPTQADKFVTDQDDESYNIGLGFACASCGTRTNVDFLCVCGTQHNGDGTIQENNLSLSSETNGDNLTLETSQLCNDIIKSEIQPGYLGDVEYIIAGQVQKSKVNILSCERLTKTKSRIEFTASSNTFRCVVDVGNDTIGNFQEWKGTKKSKFTKKTWKQYKPSEILIGFLKEKLF